MKNIRSVLIFIALLFLPFMLSAQSLKSRIAKAMNVFTSDPQLTTAITSLTVLNAKNGEVIYTLNQNFGLAPASCQKTVTAATAFYLLGKDYRYHTSLYGTGNINDGMLNGNLIIKGSGDPTLGSWRYPSTKMETVLKEWVQAVKEAGIKQINGRVIGDATVFDTQMVPDGWIWQDMGNYYGAGVSGLTWHENQYDVHLLPGERTGEAVKFIRTEPVISQLHFVNELKTGMRGSDDQTYIYTAPYTHLAFLRGTSPAGDKHFMVSGSVPDPALFCANSLQQALIHAGIHVTSPVTTVRLLKLSDQKPEEDTLLLYTHVSPPLDSIVYWFLKRSINLYGEHLIKTIALKMNKPVCTDTGVAIERRFWEDKGLSSSALHIIDGSGLSPGNRITTLAMAKVLYQIRNQTWFSLYHNCLPVIHQIHMKSGHINDVASYAGYLNSAEGIPLVFSFIVNNYDGSTSAVNRKMWRVLDEMK